MKERASPAGDDAGTSVTHAFESFFAAERPRLFATLVLIVADRGIAEDLTQEAFVRIWERWDHVQQHPDPRGYLYKTALNLVRHRRRRALRAPQTEVPVENDAFAAVEHRRDLAVALRLLSPRQRAALVLTDVLGLDSSEAAGILHVRSATVRSLASQGRATLRRSRGDTDD